MEEKRSSFSGKVGFVLSAAGAAVGLGNIWRFPYLAARYGGGIFLLVYVLLSLTLGKALMVTEIALGRRTGKSPIGAFGSLHRRFSFIGALASIVPAVILPYYSVIGGWVTKYALAFLSGSSAATVSEGYFEDFVGSVGEPLLWFFLFTLLCTLIVLAGVDRGVEAISKVMMPLLILLVLCIAIFSLISVEGAMEGALYYLKPDLSRFTPMTPVAAMGQLFYSMSLAMGVMITYGSYMRRDISIKSSAGQIELFDTAVAFLSGLMILPAVFAFGGEEALAESGPSLMFVTLPRIFASMRGGAVIGAAFFLMVFLAALTSTVSMMETVVSTLLDRTSIKRRLCCILVAGLALILGTVTALGYNVLDGLRPLGMYLLDLFDFLSNGLLMPTVALLTCIFVGHVVGTRTVTEELSLSDKVPGRAYTLTVKYLAPACILAILISSVLGVLGVISI